MARAKPKKSVSVSKPKAEPVLATAGGDDEWSSF
jgi:hypothetical protein